jgi:hypothetical protein
MPYFVTQGARILLGLLFLMLGLNGFYTFIPVPEFHPFMEILVSSGFIYLVKVVEVVAGLLLLFKRWIPAALVLLGADIVNITAYHLLLDPRNIIVVPIIWILFTVVFWEHRKAFRPLFTP